MKETSLSFCPSDLTWLSMIRLAKDTTTTQPAFNFFYQNEDGNFCLCCCHPSLRLFCCCFEWCQLIVCVACQVGVTRMTRGASVMWLHFFIVFCKFFIVCFDAELNVLVAGDLRHEFAWSAWGFFFIVSPGSWLQLLCLHHGNWCSFDNDCHCRMSIVVILTTSSRRLCCVRWQGRLVASRLITTALLVALKELLSWERFCASWW